MTVTRRGETDIVAFGRRSVLEALGSKDVVVEYVCASRAVPADLRRDLAAVCRTRDVLFEVVDARTVHEISREPRHDQDVAAKVRMTNISEAEEFVASLTGAAARTRASVLAVDGVTNPQNLGMIIRSAVAAGITGFIWPTEGCPWINGLVVKASAGTIFRCPIVRCDSLQEAIWAFQAGGFHVCGLAGEARQSLFEFEPPHRGVYILGSETGGMTRAIRGLVDSTVKIPMRNGVESLNVAVTAALVSFHVAPAEVDA